MIHTPRRLAYSFVEGLFHPPCLRRYISLALLLSLLLPSFVVAQQSQERILVPTNQQASAAGQTGGRAAKPELVLQTGITNPISSIAFSPDGQLLASVSLLGGAIKLWETASGRELYSFNLGERANFLDARYFALAFSADGRVLISVSGGNVRHWDTRTGKLLRNLRLQTDSDLAYLRLSADGRLLVAITNTEQSLSLWNTESGQQLQAINGNLDSNTYFHSAAFSPDGQILATLEESRKGRSDVTNLNLRDVASWRQIRSTQVLDDQRSLGNQNPTSLTGLCFSPDGHTLAALRNITLQQASGTLGVAPRTIGRDSFLTLWDAASGRELRTTAIANIRRSYEGSYDRYTFNFLNTIAFSPDSQQIAVPFNEQTVKLFESASGRELSTFTPNPDDVLAVTFTADGRLVATSDIHNSIKIWDVTSASTTGRVSLIRSIGKGATPVQNLAFRSDGRALAISSREAVSVWDMTAGTARRTVTLPSPNYTTLTDLFEDHQVPVFFSPDGQFIGANNRDGQVKLWEVQSGHEVKSFALPEAKTLGSASISSDGKMVALLDRASKSGAANLPATAPANPSQPQNNPAPSATQPPPASVPPTPVDPKKQREEEQKRQKEALKQAKDAQRDMMKQMEQMMKSGKMPQQMPSMDQIQKMTEAMQRGEFGKAMEMMPQVAGNMPILAGTMSSPRSIRILDVTAGNEIRSVPLSQTLGAMQESFIAFSPDARAIAASNGGRSIKVHDLTSGRERFTLAPERGLRIDSFTWSPNGRMIASGCMETKGNLNLNSANINIDDAYTFTLKLWDVSDAAAGARELFTLNGHNTQITAVAFSPDNRLIASSGDDGKMKLWEIASGRELFTMSGHTHMVTALTFSPDGKYLLSGSWDGSTKLWDVQTGELLLTMVSLNQGADWLAITPDGLFDGTPAAWRQILWRFSPNINDVAPVEIFFNEFFYPGLLSAIYSGKRPRAAADVSQKDRRQPLVSLTRSDGQTTNVSTRNLKVRVEISEPASTNPAATGAQDVRLFRNGTLVKVWHGDVLQGKKQVALETTLPIVAGENRLTAYAFNHDNVKSADASLTAIGDAQLRRKGTAYILAVGVNAYANEQYNLKYAVADATAFADEVRSQQTKLQTYERVEVVTLTDKESTKANILLALRRLANDDEQLPPAAPAQLARLQRAQPEDAVMIYFAGHGTAQGARFYLVPHDLGYAGDRDQLDAKSVQAILAHSLSDLELEAAVEGLDAEQLLMVIDACNSGQALEAEEKRRGPMNSKGLAQLAYEKGRYILTAAQSYQAALEAAQLGHGYLTYALIEEGLKTAAADTDAKDGTVMAREWFSYATERVPQMQEREMRSRLLLQKEKKDVAFVEGEEQIKDPTKRNVQRPRAFYRREIETRPLVVAKP
jgi:WD40 repeat protein/uncharacterized caspase-like protein